MRALANGGVYVNFAGFENDVGSDAVLGASAERLEQVRSAFDPDGLFEAAAHRP